MALAKDKLETLKKELINRRDALVQGLHQTNAEMIDGDPFVADSVDQASMDSDKTLALQIKHREARVLSEIDEALRRMDMGQFGECERCGDSISMARMRAFPAATLCIDCKAEIESEQRRQA